MKWRFCRNHWSWPKVREVFPCTVENASGQGVSLIFVRKAGFPTGSVRRHPHLAYRAPPGGSPGGCLFRPQRSSNLGATAVTLRSFCTASPEVSRSCKAQKYRWKLFLQLASTLPARRVNVSGKVGRWLHHHHHLPGRSGCGRWLCVC